MEIFLGYFLYAMSLLTVGGIYALLALGLNVQWGFAGLFNAGVAGFAAIGAYTYALLTTAESQFHFGGLELPLVVGDILAMIFAGNSCYYNWINMYSIESRLFSYCYYWNCRDNQINFEK